MSNNFRRNDKTSAGEKITAILFVAIAFGAVFLTLHKEELANGQIVEVALGYITG